MIDLYSLNLPQVNPAEFSPAVWAYIGDAVYELFIRCYLLTNGPTKTKFLHQAATAKVRASFSSRIIKTDRVVFNGSRVGDFETRP